MSELSHSKAFLWQDADAVLIGNREGDTLVLTRAWRSADRLEHVRRWTFRDRRNFRGQVRRLVQEGSTGAEVWQPAVAAAGNWLDSAGDGIPERTD